MIGNLQHIFFNVVSIRYQLIFFNMFQVTDCQENAGNNYLYTH